MQARKLIPVVVLILALFCPLSAQQTATSFRFPLDTYTVGSNDFWSYGLVREGQWHLGEDAIANAGISIRAAANGIVKLASGTVTGYGGMYIIEHTLLSGEKVCAVYPHMNFASFTKTVGQIVTVGEYLGSVGSYSQNGGWSEHFHFGIRKGAYNSYYSNGEWSYAGYTSYASTKDNWHDPTDFIQSYPVGLFSDGRIDQRFRDLYAEAGGAATFGLPFDNGKTAYVHYWPDNGNPNQPGSSDALAVQDFKKGDIWSQLVLNSANNNAYAVFNKILYFWNSNWGYRDYGPPFTNEFAIAYVGNKCGSFGEQDILSPR